MRVSRHNRSTINADAPAHHTSDVFWLPAARGKTCVHKTLSTMSVYSLTADTDADAILLLEAVMAAARYDHLAVEFEVVEEDALLKAARTVQKDGWVLRQEIRSSFYGPPTSDVGRFRLILDAARKPQGRRRYKEDHPIGHKPVAKKQRLEKEIPATPAEGETPETQHEVLKKTVDRTCQEAHEHDDAAQSGDVQVDEGDGEEGGEGSGDDDVRQKASVEDDGAH